MFDLTNWTYDASNVNANGTTYIDGGATEGMCESYREAFYEIIKIYDVLRKAHPKEAIKTGDLTVEKGDALVGGRFYTKKGLTLMGATALKGNVYLEINGKGAKQAEGTIPSTGSSSLVIGRLR